MVMVACSGIELLGHLTHEGHGRDGGGSYFADFWRTYLYPDDVARAQAGPAIYDLVRNGIGHMFVAKPGITVTKEGNHAQHLVSDDVHGFLVDALVLVEDLKRAYASRVMPLLSVPEARKKMQARL